MQRLFSLRANEISQLLCRHVLQVGKLASPRARPQASRSSQQSSRSPPAASPLLLNEQGFRASVLSPDTACGAPLLEIVAFR
jgi:hypothetical protein